MKKMKQILSMALALMLLLAMIPTASALEIDGGWATIEAEDSAEDFYAALGAEDVENIEVHRELTIDKNITIPDGMLVFFDLGVTVADGVSITFEGSGDIYVYEYLALEGTIHLSHENSWLNINPGTKVSGDGTVDGIGVLRLNEGNTQGYGEVNHPTEVEYIELGSVKVGSGVDMGRALGVTADHFAKVTRPLDEYEFIWIMTNYEDKACDLVIDKKVNVGDLYLNGSYWYDAQTDRNVRFPVNLIVASGGELNVHGLLDVDCCTVTVKDGGKLTATDWIYLNAAYTDEENYEPAAKMTIEKGGIINTNGLFGDTSDVESDLPAVNAQGEFNYGVVYSGSVLINGEVVDMLSESDFTDVPEDAYYRESVAFAVRYGITNGTSATTFSPNAPCTRGQVVTFLWRAAGSPEPESANNPFKDVPAGQYYTDAVLWAVEEGITNGTSANTFSPNAPCTRGQVVTFLWRAVGEPEAAESKVDFTDVAANAYYYNATVWAVEEGITNGMSATAFGPDVTCNRAQIVTFLYRLLMA